MLLANFNRKEHLRHRAVSLRQHGFLVRYKITKSNSKTKLKLNLHHVIGYCEQETCIVQFQQKYCYTKAESRTTETCFSSVWLVCCSTCSQSESRLVTKRKQNDVTLLNKFLLIFIFVKTCIKAIHMRRCVTRKLLTYSYKAHYPLLRTCNVPCNASSHICLRSQLKQLAKLFELFVKVQTQLKHVCVWP